MQYMIDDTSVALRAKAGRVPPVKGFKTDDPVLQQILQLVEQAPAVQLWYDQYLPPAVAEVHKDTSQALFALSMTPPGWSATPSWQRSEPAPIFET